MNTEQLAVNHVSTLIALCPHLTPYISVNDKTPFTDGHIDMYSSESKTNDTIIGRVDVQVKGRTIKAARKAPGTYRVRVADLRAYLNFSGVLYLVVNIHEKPHKMKASYALLNPFRIDELLGGIKSGQKSVAIRLKPFPKKPEQIEELIRFALRTKVQNPQQGIDPLLLSNLTEVTIHGLGKVNLSKPVEFNLSEDDVAAFLKTEGGMEIALSGYIQVTPHEYIGEQFNGTIGSGHVLFENPIRRRVDDKTVEVQLSDNLTFSVAHTASGYSGGLSFQLADRLDQRLRDIGFYLACIETGELKLNGVSMKIAVDSATDIDDLQSHYMHLQELESLCEKLAVPTALIPLREITEERSKQLGLVHRSLVLGIPLKGQQAIHGRIFQPVGNEGLELMTVELGDGWEIVDIFAPNLPVQFATVVESESGEKSWRVITPYEILDAHQTARTLNLHLNTIVSAYEAIEQHDNAGTLANQTVLRLIHAADINPSRKTEFLDGAKALNEWLISRNGEETHHIINQMQIYTRSRSLIDNEQRILRDIRRAAIKKSNRNALQIELSCAILLDETKEIHDAIDRISDKDLNEFKTWPIWNLIGTNGKAETIAATPEAKAINLWMKRTEE